MAQPARQCVLYLGNKDPIREGRAVRAGLVLSVQISHQAGTYHLDWTFVLNGAWESFSLLIDC